MFRTNSGDQTAPLLAHEHKATQLDSSAKVDGLNDDNLRLLKSIYAIESKNTNQASIQQPKWMMSDTKTSVREYKDSKDKQPIRHVLESRDCIMPLNAGQTFSLISAMLDDKTSAYESELKPAVIPSVLISGAAPIGFLKQYQNKHKTPKHSDASFQKKDLDARIENLTRAAHFFYDSIKSIGEGDEWKTRWEKCIADNEQKLLEDNSALDVSVSFSQVTSPLSNIVDLAKTEITKFAEEVTKQKTIADDDINDKLQAFVKKVETQMAKSFKEFLDNPLFVEKASSNDDSFNLFSTLGAVFGKSNRERSAPVLLSIEATMMMFEFHQKRPVVTVTKHPDDVISIQRTVPLFDLTDQQCEIYAKMVDKDNPVIPDWFNDCLDLWTQWTCLDKLKQIKKDILFSDNFHQGIRKYFGHPSLLRLLGVANRHRYEVAIIKYCGNTQFEVTKFAIDRSAYPGVSLRHVENKQSRRELVSINQRQVAGDLARDRLQYREFYGMPPSQKVHQSQTNLSLLSAMGKNVSRVLTKTVLSEDDNNYEMASLSHQEMLALNNKRDMNIYDPHSLQNRLASFPINKLRSDGSLLQSDLFFTPKILYLELGDIRQRFRDLASSSALLKSTGIPFEKIDQWLHRLMTTFAVHKHDWNVSSYRARRNDLIEGLDTIISKLNEINGSWQVVSQCRKFSKQLQFAFAAVRLGHVISQRAPAGGILDSEGRNLVAHQAAMFLCLGGELSKKLVHCKTGQDRTGEELSITLSEMVYFVRFGQPLMQALTNQGFTLQRYNQFFDKPYYGDSAVTLGNKQPGEASEFDKSLVEVKMSGHQQTVRSEQYGDANPGELQGGSSFALKDCGILDQPTKAKLAEEKEFSQVKADIAAGLNKPSDRPSDRSSENASSRVSDVPLQSIHVNGFVGDGVNFSQVEYKETKTRSVSDKSTERLLWEQFPLAKPVVKKPLIAILKAIFLANNQIFPDTDNEVNVLLCFLGFRFRDISDEVLKSAYDLWLAYGVPKTLLKQVLTELGSDVNHELLKHFQAMLGFEQYMPLLTELLFNHHFVTQSLLKDRLPAQIKTQMPLPRIMHAAIGEVVATLSKYANKVTKLLLVEEMDASQLESKISAYKHPYFNGAMKRFKIALQKTQALEYEVDTKDVTGQNYRNLRAAYSDEASMETLTEGNVWRRVLSGIGESYDCRANLEANLMKYPFGRSFTRHARDNASFMIKVVIGGILFFGGTLAAYAVLGDALGMNRDEFKVYTGWAQRIIMGVTTLLILHRLFKPLVERCLHNDFVAEVRAMPNHRQQFFSQADVHIVEIGEGVDNNVKMTELPKNLAVAKHG